MGPDDLISVDEAVENTTVITASPIQPGASTHTNSKSDLIVLFVAAAVFLGCAFSPPHLMDDVDSVQAQIARNMLQSGDWVTARLDGVPHLEKSPLNYWLVAGSFAIFEIHEWPGRLPLPLLVLTLCWLTPQLGGWAL